jgi:ankyrin repeat protein
VNAKNPNGATPLMYATNGDNPEAMIRAFLKAGADAKAKDSDGKTAFDYAQTNEKLKGTDAYRQLQQASQ